MLPSRCSLAVEISTGSHWEGVVEMVYLERQGGIAFRQPDWRDVEEVEELPLGKKSAALVKQ